MVVTPTLKAAEVAARAGRATRSPLPGWSTSTASAGTRTAAGPGSPSTADDPGRVLMPGDVLVVDEAGMLDQDTARALLTIADEAGARVAFVGDRHQLPAVGRGGVLDLAHRWAPPGACLTLDTIHRFADPDVRRPQPADAQLVSAVVRSSTPC